MERCGAPRIAFPRCSVYGSSITLGLQNSHQRWFILGIVTLAQVGVALIHLGVPALVPFIQKDLKLSRTEVGVVSSVLNGGVVVVAIAAGKAVDYLGERWVIAAGAMLSGLVMMGIQSVESFEAFLFTLVFIGFATASCTPAGSKAVAAWFPASERGTAMGVRQMSVPLGGAIAALTLPSVALIHGWRFALFLAGLTSLAIGLGVLCLYREPGELPAPISRTSAAGLRDLARRKDILAGLIYAFILSGGQWCFLTYVELYLNETLGMSIPLAASLLALGQVSGTGSRVLWGLFSDRFFCGRRKPVLLLVGALAALTTLFVALLSSATPFWIIWILIALWGSTVMGWNGIYLALVSELAGIRVAGLAIGLSSTFAFLGIVVVPPVFGFLVDAGFSYRLAWIALAGVLMVPLIFLRWVQEER